MCDRNDLLALTRQRRPELRATTELQQASDRAGRYVPRAVRWYGVDLHQRKQGHEEQRCFPEIAAFWRTPFQNGPVRR
jgi:hypothetical protein